MAVLCCILLEIGLFAARGFHEKKQYEIALSLPNGDVKQPKVKTDAPKAESKAEKKDDAELIANAEFIARLKGQLQAFAVENKKFDAINESLINDLNNERRMTATLKSSLNDMGKPTAT